MLNIDAFGGYHSSAKDQDRILKLRLDEGADYNALCGYYGGAF